MSASRTPRPSQGQHLRTVFQSDKVQQSSFAHHLRALGMGSEGTVSKWANGRLLMPFDAWQQLLVHLGDDADVALQAACPPGFVVVRLPEGAEAAGDVLRQTVGVNAAIAQLQSSVADMDADGVREDHEIQAVRAIIQKALRQLAAIDTELTVPQLRAAS